MVAALDQIQGDVGPGQPFDQGRLAPPRHHVVGPALQDVDGRRHGQGAAQQQPVARLLEHAAGQDVFAQPLLDDQGLALAQDGLALVIGERLEQSFRQAMTISGGSPSALVGSPITIVLLLLIIAALVVPYVMRRLKVIRAARLLPEGAD